MNSLKKIEEILKIKELNCIKKQDIESKNTKLKYDYSFNFKKNLYMLVISVFFFTLSFLFPSLNVFFVLAPITLLSIPFGKSLNLNYSNLDDELGVAFLFGFLFYIIFVLLCLSFNTLLGTEKYIVLKYFFETYSLNYYIFLIIHFLPFSLCIFTYFNYKYKLKYRMNEDIKDNNNKILKLKKEIKEDENKTSHFINLFRNIDDHYEIEYLEAYAEIHNLKLVQDELSLVKKIFIEKKGFLNKNEYLVSQREENNLEIKNV